MLGANKNTMKTNLPQTIETIEQAKAFLTELNSNNEAYHPEESALGVLWDPDRRPTNAELTKLDFLMDKVNQLGSWCPCEFLLSL